MSGVWIAVAYLLFVAFVVWRLHAAPLQPDILPLPPQGYFWRVDKDARRLELSSSDGGRVYGMPLIFVNEKHLLSAARILLHSHEKDQR